jgi:tetratricopeptide (TPR) repeat protein
MRCVQVLSALGLRRLLAGHRPAGGISAWPEELFAPCRDHVVRALRQANERAWLAVEAVLAGDEWWEVAQVHWERSLEDEFYRPLRALCAAVSLDLPGEVRPFQQALAAARQGRLLTAGPLAIDTLLALDSEANGRQEVADEWLALVRLADRLEADGHGRLRPLLLLRHGSRDPLLVVLVAALFRQAVAADPDLFGDLLSLWTEEEGTQGSVEELGTLAVALERHRSRLEAMIQEVRGPAPSRPPAPEGEGQDPAALLPAALAAYETALRLAPAVASMYLQRAEALVKEGRHDEALADCDRALRCDPDLAGAHLLRGSIRAQREEFAAALEDFIAARHLQPDNARAHHFAGLAYAKLGQQARALASLAEALRLEPSNARVYANRAVVLQMFGQSDRALDDLAKAAEASPRYAAAYCFHRGQADAARGDYTQAVAHYSLALLLDPENVAAREARAKALEDARTSPERQRRDTSPERQRWDPSPAAAPAARPTPPAPAPGAPRTLAAAPEVSGTSRPPEPAPAAQPEPVAPPRGEAPVQPPVRALTAPPDPKKDGEKKVLDEGPLLVPELPELAPIPLDQPLAPTPPMARGPEPVVPAAPASSGEKKPPVARLLTPAPSPPKTEEKGERGSVAPAPSSPKRESGEKDSPRAPAPPKRESGEAPGKPASPTRPAVAKPPSALVCPPAAPAAAPPSGAEGQGKPDTKTHKAAPDTALIELGKEYPPPVEEPAAQSQRPDKLAAPPRRSPATPLPATKRDGVPPAPGGEKAASPKDAASAKGERQEPAKKEGPAGGDNGGPLRKKKKKRRKAAKPFAEAKGSKRKKKKKKKPKTREVDVAALLLEEELKEDAPPGETHSDPAEQEAYEREQKLLREQKEQRRAAALGQAPAAPAGEAPKTAADAAAATLQAALWRRKDEPAPRVRRPVAKQKTGAGGEAPARPWKRRVLLASLAGLLLFGAIKLMGFVTDNTPREDEVQASARLTVAELCRHFDVNPVSAETELVGKVIEVSGRVADVKVEQDDCYVLLYDRDPRGRNAQGRVRCKMVAQLDVRQASKFSDLDVQGQATVKGLCLGKENGVVRLEKTWLVNVRAH